MCAQKQSDSWKIGSRIQGTKAKKPMKNILNKLNN